MDKVIIDGVDVSGCEFYCDKYCTLSNDRNERLPFAEKCIGYSDCIYKQLKRKEQESEELKKDVETWNYQADKQAELSNIWFNTAETLNKALQEIRELVEKEIVCDDCNFEGTDKCDARMCTHFYLNDFSKDILDKINEIIGAE